MLDLLPLMTADFEIVKILNQEFAEARMRNASYSLRAFAKRLHVPVSSVSEVMRGKRRITKKMAAKMLERLRVDPQLVPGLTKQLKDNYRAGALPPEKMEYAQLNSDQFQAISEWYHFGILSLAETHGFNWDPKFAAHRLALPVSKVKDAFARLERLRLIEPTVSGSFRLTAERLATTQDVRDISIQKAHSENLDLARNSLEHDDVECRDFSFMTLAADPRRLGEAKKRIQKFRRELCAYLEGGTKTEVYRLAIQVFPLTRASKPKGRL
ncbi:MAG: TIGR02147 family protein [Bdellovibrionia bacterium]